MKSLIYLYYVIVTQTFQRLVVYFNRGISLKIRKNTQRYYILN